VLPPSTGRASFPEVAVHLLTFLLGAVCALALAAVLERDRRRLQQRHEATLTEALQLERTRVAQLQGMLDQAAAQRLDVVPPVPPTIDPAQTPLPSEVLDELAHLDDEQARTEFEAVIRAHWARNPNATATELLAAAMP